MRPFAAILALVLVSGCTPRIAIYEERVPVTSRYTLTFGPQDTTLTGTLTMLSDKLQVLDVTRIEHDTAFRVARLMMDSIIKPYNGGAINVRIRPHEQGLWGYVIKVDVLGHNETPLARQAVRGEVESILREQGRRLDRLIKNEGLRGWGTDGVLNLEGYDSNKKVAIYSVAGRAYSEGNLEHEPLLVVWASPEGKLLKAWLTVVTRRLERN